MLNVCFTMGSSNECNSTSLNKKSFYMLNNCDDSTVVLQNLREKLNKCMFSHISESGGQLHDVVSTVLHVMLQLYSKNTVAARNNNDGTLELIKSNLEIAISLTDMLSNLLENIVRNGPVSFNEVSNIPGDMGNILFSSFEHCKSSQRIYGSLHNSISEILVLFRKAQELHVKFLCFLDTHLAFNFLNQTDVDAYEEILNTILKISKILLGVNMKSMADNWKTFITLIQKMFEQNFTFFSLSPAIQLLTEEINESLSTILEMEIINSKKSIQQLKVTGFLLKVILKLLENTWSIGESYDKILDFWIMIYRHGTSLPDKNVPDEIITSVNNLFQLCRDSVATLLLCDSIFLKNFCLLREKSFCSIQESFGLLMFGNDLMKDLPRFLNYQPKKADLQIVSLLQSFISLMKNCYSGYFYDHNSSFYQELTMNTCVILLLFPQHFLQVEEMLLDCIVDSNIWVSVIAMDIWCLTLRHSPETVCRSTLTALIKKIEELKLGVVLQAPVIVRLKILTQRIFKILSLHVKNEELSKYNPSSNIFVWQTISLRNVPLSHRYYVEFIIADILEKSNNVLKTDDCSLNDMISLMECVDVLSHTNFIDLELKALKLIPVIILLWSFDTEHSLKNNIFFKYYSYKLLKITVAVAKELTPENLLQILNQVKLLPGGPLNKLLICGVLEAVSKSNFTWYAEKVTLFLLISDLFQLLLNDTNSVIVAKALQSLHKMYDYGKYEEVIQKVKSSNNKLVNNYMEKRAVDDIYSAKHFKKFHCANVQHHCYEWTIACQPLSKRIKVENDESNVNAVIETLKGDIDKLIGIKNKSGLNLKQTSDLRFILNRVKTLID